MAGTTAVAGTTGAMIAVGGMIGATTGAGGMIGAAIATIAVGEATAAGAGIATHGTAIAAPARRLCAAG